MNMILHNNPTALIVQGNTLADPKFTDGDTLKTFDYVVANPPFSDKRWSTGLDPANDPYERLKPSACRPPSRATTPTCCTSSAREEYRQRGVHPAARRALPGQCRGRHRRALVRKGYIKGIIGLPTNLFYGTGIPACIIVVDKEDAHTRQGIFMIDASSGYMKDGPRTACAPRTSTRSPMSSPGSSKFPNTRAWSALRRSRKMSSTSTCRATLTARSRRTYRTSRDTCAAAFPTATSLHSKNTGPFSPDSNPRSSIRSATTILNYPFSILN